MHFRFHEIFLSFFVSVISSEINWYCFWLSQKVIIKRWHLWIFTLFTGLLRFTTFLFLLDQIVFNTSTYNGNNLSSLMNLVKTSIISVRTSQMKFGLIFTHCTDVRFASVLSGGFATMAVINPPERKLAKCTFVYCVLSKNQNRQTWTDVITH